MLTRRALLFGVAGGAVLAPLVLQAQDTGKGHRVVFAMTSGEAADWGMTIANIDNLVADFKPESVAVEVVAYGPGLAMVLKGSSVADAVARLQSPAVRFVACENAMRARGKTKADLLPGVGTVPAGIGEVVRREEQGWSYIKAGR